MHFSCPVFLASFGHVLDNMLVSCPLYLDMNEEERQCLLDEKSN